LFWTAFIPSDAISVNLASGTARMCLTDSFVIDAHDVVSGLTRQPADQASVSLVVHWESPGDGGHVHDTTNRFDLTYVNTSSRIEWSATKQGFKFVSDPSDTSVNDLSVLGTEINGLFF
jgi:hypothetical protein